jgi:hypothetical protein
MSPLKRYLLPLLILLIIASFIIGFRSFLMTNIIEPVALLFWAIWRLVSSVDQNTYWMFLILLCMFLVIYLVASGRRRAPGSAYHEINNSLNRIEYWKKLIKDSSLGSRDREYLQSNLRNLFNAASTQADRLDLYGSSDIPIQEMDSLSPSAHRFLFPPKEKQRGISRNQQLDIISFTPKWLRRLIRRIFYKDNSLIDEILQNLENKLEMNNEK